MKCLFGANEACVMIFMRRGGSQDASRNLLEVLGAFLFSTPHIFVANFFQNKMPDNLCHFFFVL